MSTAKIIDGVSLGLFPGSAPPAGRSGFVARAKAWLDRHQQRKALGRLDDRMLRDLGLSQADAWLEVEKPFWRA